MVTFLRLLVILTFAFLILTPAPLPAAEWRDVTDERLLNAGNDPANWRMYNRTSDGLRYIPLQQNDSDNVKKLVANLNFSGGALSDQQTKPVPNQDEECTAST